MYQQDFNKLKYLTSFEDSLWFMNYHLNCCHHPHKPSLAILSFLLFSFLSALFERFLCTLRRLASRQIVIWRFLVLVAGALDFFIFFNFRPHYFYYLSQLFSFFMVFVFYQIKAIFRFDPIKLKFYLWRIITFALTIADF